MSLVMKVQYFNNFISLMLKIFIPSFHMQTIMINNYYYLLAKILKHPFLTFLQVNLHLYYYYYYLFNYIILFNYLL